jgi:hypothetical protein
MARNAAPEERVNKIYVESTYSDNGKKVGSNGKKVGALIVCMTKLTPFFRFLEECCCTFVHA